MSKYEALGRFLQGLSAASVHLSFEEVEKILGFKLPPSAYVHSEWWSNNPVGHSHARSWVEAGWRTNKVDRKSRTLVFHRQSVASTEVGASPLFGRMRGSIVSRPDVDLTEPTREIWNAERGILHNYALILDTGCLL